MAGWEVLSRFAYPEMQPRPVVSIAGLTMVACSNSDVYLRGVTHHPNMR